MTGRTLVLLSSGLDSTVLAAHEAQSSAVLPVYVRVGLAWEPAEWDMLGRLLAAPVFEGKIESPRRVEFSMRDVYPPTHWGMLGVPPAYDTPDEDVFLPGRNLVLLTVAGVVAVATGATRIVMGPLAGSPFPDAKPEFFAAMARALSIGLDRPLEIATPFVTWKKADVIRRGLELGVPFDLTRSCMSAGSTRSADSSYAVHCGLCSKCRERRDGFAAAGITDPTTYANPSPRNSKL